MSRNLEIDRLRSITALIVIACHIYLFFYPEVSLMLFKHGFATTIIDLSFAISGYVISSILVKQIDQLKTDHVSLIANLKGFFIRRLFRIYPALWTVFFLVILISAIFSHSYLFSSPYHVFKTSFLLLTSTYNYYFITKYFSFALIPYWSLTIEEQFYLIYPVFLLLTKNNKQRAKIFIGLILLITFILRPLTIHFYEIEGLYFTQTRCDSIMYGCLIYMLSQQPWFNNLKPKSKLYPWLCMGFVILFLYIIVGITTLGYSPAVYLTVNNFLISTLLIVALFERNIISFPLMIQKPLDMLAPRSYTLYIIHTPIILLVDTMYVQYLKSTHDFDVVKIIITVLLILIANEILYRGVLLPGLSKGKEISDNMVEASKTIHTGTVVQATNTY